MPARIFSVKRGYPIFINVKRDCCIRLIKSGITRDHIRRQVPRVKRKRKYRPISTRSRKSGRERRGMNDEGRNGESAEEGGPRLAGEEELKLSSLHFRNGGGRRNSLTFLIPSRIGARARATLEKIRSSSFLRGAEGRCASFYTSPGINVSSTGSTRGPYNPRISANAPGMDERRLARAQCSTRHEAQFSSIKRALPTWFFPNLDSSWLRGRIARFIRATRTYRAPSSVIYIRSPLPPSLSLSLSLARVARRFPHVVTMRGSPDVVDQRDGLYRTDRPTDLASRHFSLVFGNWITSSREEPSDAIVRGLLAAVAWNRRCSMAAGIPRFES